MDSQPPDPLDARLNAWFDGELPPGERAEVEAALAGRADLAERVRAWEADRAALRAQFAAVLDEPVPARLAAVAQDGDADPDTQARGPAQDAAGPPFAGSRKDAAGARGRTAPLRPVPGTALPPSAWRWAAAVAIFLLGGLAGAGLVGGLAPRPRAPAAAGPAGEDAAWVHRALVAHAVYVPEQRHPVEVTAAESRAQDNHLARWLTRRLALPVKLFDLGGFGFELVGGRLLPDATGPSAQLMYQNAAGERVTVYLRKPDAVPADDPALAAFRYERQGELGLFYWIERSGADTGAAASAASGTTPAAAPLTGYALVGTLPRERLLALAEAIYRQGREAP